MDELNHLFYGHADDAVAHSQVKMCWIIFHYFLFRSNSCLTVLHTCSRFCQADLVIALVQGLGLNEQELEMRSILVRVQQVWLMSWGNVLGTMSIVNVISF